MTKTQTPTPTPETDAAEIIVDGYAPGEKRIVVHVEFSRNLERQRDQVRRELDELIDLLSDIDNRAQRIQEDKALVFIEANYIRLVIRRAIESTKPQPCGGDVIDIPQQAADAYEKYCSAMNQKFSQAEFCVALYMLDIANKRIAADALLNKEGEFKPVCYGIFADDGAMFWSNTFCIADDPTEISWRMTSE